MKRVLATLYLIFAASINAIGAAELDEQTITKAERDALRNARGLVSLDNEFVPKGSMMFGSGFSYSAHDNEDYKLLLVDDIDSYGYTVQASPMVAYAVARNMSVGVRGVYGRSLTKLSNAGLSFGDPDDGGVNLTIEDYYLLTHSYSVMGIWRQYIPLGKNRRFALFNEMQLGVGGSQTKAAFDNPTKGTYATGYNVSIGASPGIVAFATNDVAFEVSVGMVGLSYSKTKQIHNQVDEGSVSSTLFNFKINLLAIGLGVAFYL